jgi:dipeptidyl aminopeptidase/acylaminoacyl peptidase
VKPRLPIVIAVTALAAVIAFAGAVAARTVLRERAYLHPPRRSIAPRLAEQGIAGLSNVAFTSADGSTLRGWFAPSTNGAAVVILHGSMGDRLDSMPEARLLARAGFGVLVFDWPRHGESDGVVRWGSSERAALTAALDFLGKQPGIDAARLGGVGLSLGGYILAQVAATDPRLRAVVLAGTPSNAAELVRHENRRWGPLSRWPALWVQKYLFEPDVMPAERMVAKLAPRALLVVTGDKDTVVPASMTETLFNTAHEPKELLIVHGAGHGGYTSVPETTYPTRLVAFFQRWLRPS